MDTTPTFVIRAMTTADWAAVRDIYREGISTGDATFQLEAPPFEDWDRGHLKTCRLVAVEDSAVVGWAALSPVSSRPVYAGVCEVSVYVAQHRRGRGVGSRLLESLIAESERHGIWTLQAGIFPENVSSVSLHERCGFRIVGRRHRLGNMHGRWRDVLLLERRSTVVGGDNAEQLTRRQFVGVTGAALLGAYLRHPAERPRTQRPLPVPSASQLAWQRDELALFLHFGVNTFTDREWGEGRENPSIFLPRRLNARQWARAAREGGFRAMILTAKHHDGFCLWPTTTTSHSVAQSSWRRGKGDVVREFVNACRAEGLRAGLYLSPWDRNHPAYGDSPRYNDVYARQLTELLTQYGPIAEVWFDGANGEGPNGRKQEYDWPRVFGLVHRHQPNAVVFSDAGPHVRWCGNENGAAGDPNWSSVNPDRVPFPGASAPGVTDALQHGDPAGTVWRPAEADVSIRPGWFYHEGEDTRVRSVDQLVELYFTSVGRNAKLLLNVPPTRDGLLHPTDVARLAGFRDRLRSLFRTDLTGRQDGQWRLTGERTAELEIDLGRSVRVGLARLEEDIARGQRVARYSLSGFDGSGWRELSRGTTIGYARLDRFERAQLRRVRITIEDAIAAPEPIRVRLFAGA